MYVTDDPRLSDRVRRFLTERSRRMAYMDESSIRSTAAVQIDGRREPASEDLVTAMVWFEERHGGLFYPVIGGNGMEHGLDGDAAGHHGPFGLAFTGFIDGDWTWPLDVLVDGRTAWDPAGWPYRVIDRSLDQRLEKHALLVAVRGWPHRTFTTFTPTGVSPMVDDDLLPPPVPEATGPAELWWSDGTTAVQAQLAGWPPGQDRWTVRYFAREPRMATEANDTVYASVGWYETVPGHWCALCSSFLAPGSTCVPAVDDTRC